MPVCQRWRPSVFTLACCVLLATSWRAVGEVSNKVVEHVKCWACETAIEEAARAAENSKEKDEDTLAELVDGLCTLKKKEGKWTAKYDIVREGSDTPLEFEKQEGIGKCRMECLTIQRACAMVLKNKEETIVELLMSGKSADAIKSKVCKKLCAKKLPKLTEWVDEAFSPRDQKEVEAEERVEKMRAETGQNFKMWSRDEIAGMSQADIELEAAKDALGHQRRQAKLAAEAESTGPKPSQDL